MGTIAQANASALYFATETTWGTAENVTYNVARVVSAALAQTTGNVQSQQLNTNRQPTQQIRVNVSAEGSVDFEWSAVTFDDFLSSLFGRAWSTDLNTSLTSETIDVSAVTADTCDWDASPATPFGGVEVGDWLRADGFSWSANDGTYYVSAKASSSVITVMNPDAIAETGQAGVSASGTRLVVGSALRSLSLEQLVPTDESLYELAAGVVVTGLTLDVTPGEILRGTLSWIGKNVTQSTSSVTTWGQNEILTTQIANAVDNVIAIRENNMANPEVWKVSRVSINVNSPAEPRFAISDSDGTQPGAIGVALRPFSATASVRLYVEHAASETGGIKDIIDDYLGGTSRAGFAILVKDQEDTNEYVTVFHFNKYRITNASIPIAGNDQDLFLDLEIAAEQQSGTGGSTGPWAFSVHRTKLSQ